MVCVGLCSGFSRGMCYVRGFVGFVLFVYFPSVLDWGGVVGFERGVEERRWLMHIAFSDFHALMRCVFFMSRAATHPLR